MGKKDQYNQASIYYLPDDMEIIIKRLYEIQNAMIEFQAQFEIAFPEFDRLYSGDGSGNHDYSISAVVESATYTMCRHLGSIPKQTLLELRDIYNAIPKTRIVDGKYTRTDEVSTIIMDHTYEKMTEIARYLREVEVEIPRMFRKGIAAPKVIGTVAILYVARYVLS